MKAQRWEYVDTLNILFSGRSATGPQATGINKILAPLKEDSIGPDLEKANPPGLFFNANTEENHKRKKSSFITQDTTKEKLALLAKSSHQGKNAQEKKLIVVMVKTTHVMVKRQKNLQQVNKLHLK